jgi:hypothetical protein
MSCHFGKAVPKAVHGDSLARSGFLPLQSLAAVRSKVSYADLAAVCCTLHHSLVLTICDFGYDAWQAEISN